MPATVPPQPVPQALEAAVDAFSREIPPLLPEPDRALKPTLVLPLANDREGLFTDRLRASLDRQGNYRPVEANLLEKVFAAARDFTGLGTDPSTRSMQWNPAELAKLIRSAKAEALLRGSVDRLALPETGPVEIKLRLELWELAASDPTTSVMQRSMDLERPSPATPVAVGRSHGNAVRSFVIPVFLALVWPFAVIPWMRRTIREDSNVATLKALLGITAVPLPAFLLYLICLGKGGVDIMLQCGIAAIFLFFYTAFVMNGIQKKIR